MNRFHVLALAAALAGCSENTLVFDDPVVNQPDPGTIRGRVCAPNGRSWQPDAMAYTNIYDETGLITEVRKVFSDRDGYWQLDGLPGEREYTIFVQFGQDVLQEETVFLHDSEVLYLDEPACFDPTALDIALVSGDYDDVQRVLESMGFTSYTLIDGNDPEQIRAFVTDIESMRRFDLIFFNGGHLEKTIFYDTNPANETPAIVKANLQAYVNEGGSVYATDWAYDVIEQTWPDPIDFMGDDKTPDAAQLGEYDVINAAVTDESLASFLGKNQIEVEYDLPVWPPINAVEAYTSIHLSGTVRYREGQSSYTLASVPILVSFSQGRGRVGFSTFRIAANNNADTMLTLQHILAALQN